MMSDEMLSQEEIEALLRGESLDTKPESNEETSEESSEEYNIL